jgi:hypothetical protein
MFLSLVVVSLRCPLYTPRESHRRVKAYRGRQ